MTDILLFVCLASKRLRRRRKLKGVAEEWAGLRTGAPLRWRAPVYDSTSTVSMENMRVTRAHATEEQPRVADTTYPTPTDTRRASGQCTGGENGQKKENQTNACLKMRWSGDVRFYRWRQEENVKRKGRKKRQWERGREKERK